MTSATVLDLVSWVLLVLGGLSAVVGGIGMVRLPDFYTRLHASGITDTAAAYLILAGLMVQGGLTLVTVKLAMIAFFLFFTNPTSTHALAAAAYRYGLEPMTGEAVGRRPAQTKPDGEPPSQP